MSPPQDWEHPSGPLAEVVPLGRVNEVACAVAAAHLDSVLGFPCRQQPPRSLPEEAFVPSRGQYDAGLVSEDLARGLGPGILRVGVTEADLCLPVFSFVFGEAGLDGRVALASLHRLRTDEGGRRAPRPELYARLAKVVCHEAGHALGLTHCHEPACLMRFSGDVAGLDRLALSLCPACARDLSLRRTALARETQAPEP